MNPVTIIWRFNLSEGVDPHAFFGWFEENVWTSTAAYGCSTRGYRCDTDGHDFATVAIWPAK